jgi:hypothetical protein
VIKQERLEGLVIKQERLDELVPTTSGWIVRFTLISSGEQERLDESVQSYPQVSTMVILVDFYKV